MHFYNFHIGDYLTHTLHLSPMEDLAYRRMIDWCFLNEKPLPIAVEKVCELIRMSDHKEEVVKILHEYFEKTKEGYSQKRIIEEINKYQGLKASGRIAANKRWGSKKMGNPLPTQCEPIANPIQTKNQEPITPIVPASPTGDELAFFEFWKAYPKKTGKLRAQREWKKAKPPIKEVLQALASQKNSDQWNRGFIPNPATWINEGRWMDGETNKQPSWMEKML